MSQKIEEIYVEMLAKEIAKEFDYRVHQIITDTPRKRKLRKLLEITDEEYYRRSENG